MRGGVKRYLEQQAQLDLVVKEHEDFVLSRPSYAVWVPIVVWLLMLAISEVMIIRSIAEVVVSNADSSGELYAALPMFFLYAFLIWALVVFARVLLRAYLWIYDHDLPVRPPRVGAAITAKEIAKIEISSVPVRGYRRNGGSLAWSIYLLFPDETERRKIYACLASPKFLKKRRARERARTESVIRRLAERWHLEASGIAQEGETINGSEGKF